MALVHDTELELKFVADGHAIGRREVMYNDFVLIGPSADPAGTRGKDIVAALRKLATSQSAFVSRGDNSGTHAAELRYWKLAGVDNKGPGYKACGCGMADRPVLGAIARCKADNRAAHDELYHRFRRQVAGNLYRVLGDRTDLDRRRRARRRSHRRRGSRTRARARARSP